MRSINERKYIFYYYSEQNDECVDLEKVIYARTIRIALIRFESTTRNVKRVYAITEVPLDDTINVSL